MCKFKCFSFSKGEFFFRFQPVLFVVLRKNHHLSQKIWFQKFGSTKIQWLLNPGGIVNASTMNTGLITLEGSFCGVARHLTMPLLSITKTYWGRGLVFCHLSSNSVLYLLCISCPKKHMIQHIRSPKTAIHKYKSKYMYKSMYGSGTFWVYLYSSSQK